VQDPALRCRVRVQEPALRCRIRVQDPVLRCRVLYLKEDIFEMSHFFVLWEHPKSRNIFARGYFMSIPAKFGKNIINGFLKICLVPFCI